MAHLFCTTKNVSAALLVVALGLPAYAAPTVYFDLDNTDLSGGGTAATKSDAAHAAFAGAAGSLATEDFKSFADGALPSSFLIGTVTASFTSTATVSSKIVTGAGDFSTFPISDSRFLYSESAQGTTYYTITFSAPVRALGFYISDISDWQGNTGTIPNLQLNLTQVSGNISLNLSNGLDPTTIVNGNVSFFGVIDVINPIIGFSISNPVGAPDRDAIGIDNLQIAAVPEPSQTALMLGGILVLTALQRLRRPA